VEGALPPRPQSSRSAGLGRAAVSPAGAEGQDPSATARPKMTIRVHARKPKDTNN